MPLSAASDLGLRCLPMSNKKDTRLIWVKTRTITLTDSNIFYRLLITFANRLHPDQAQSLIGSDLLTL